MKGREILYGVGAIGALGLLCMLKDTRPFTVVTLPDTQNYSQSYPEIFTEQTQWILDNMNALNIRFVVQLGDIVNVGGQEYQWINADASMSLLDGVVPYLMDVGNHDYDDQCAAAKGTTFFNSHFPSSRYAGNAWYGGGYPEGTNDNSYGLFSGGEEKFLVLALEFCPSDDVLAWADGIISAYPDRKVIVTTHCYMNADGSIVKAGDPWSCSTYGCCTGECNEGTEMWYEFVRTHPSIFLVLCGHMGPPSGVAVKSDYAGSSIVHQVYQNFQYEAEGGSGWLTYYTFIPAEGKIMLYTYSPHLGAFDPQYCYELEYPGMPPGLPEGLVAWWRFDEGEGAVAYDSAGADDAMVYEADWVEGVSSTALRFHGVETSYAEYGCMECLLEPFTISLWFNASVLDGALISYMGSVDSYGLAIAFTGNYLHAGYHDGVRVGVPITFFETDRWYHLAVVYASQMLDDVRIYVDGQDLTETSDDWWNGFGNCIGRRGINMSLTRLPFSGSIDDIMIFNRALSQQDVSNLYMRHAQA